MAAASSSSWKVADKKKLSGMVEDRSSTTNHDAPTKEKQTGSAPAKRTLLHERKLDDVERFTEENNPIPGAVEREQYNPALAMKRLASHQQLVHDSRPRCSRMLPMAQSEKVPREGSREDLVFRRYDEEDQAESDLPEPLPRVVKLPASPPPGSTRESLIDDTDIEPLPDPAGSSASPQKRTLKMKIKAITLAMRSNRPAAVPQRTGGKVSWRVKVLAMKNAIRLGRLPEEQSTQQSRVMPTPSMLQSTRQRRKKNSSISAQSALPPRKAFGQENRKLLERLSQQDEKGGAFPPMTSLKVLLSEEKSSEELLELAYDPRRLRGEIRALLAKHAREEKRRQALEDADSKERRGQGASPAQRRYTSAQVEAEEQLPSYKMPKEQFAKLVASQDRLSGNQMVVARLMQAVMDLSKGQTRTCSLRLGRWYTCLDPDSWVINAWTVVYMLLILHITTVGLFNITFGPELSSSSSPPPSSSSDECAVSFSVLQWFDAGVDLFFMVDILLRLLLFGQIVESSSGRGRAAKSQMEVVVDPDRVFRNYAKNSLAVDAITGCPISWISMGLEAACYTSDSTPLLLARSLRIFRITRIVKLFRTYKVRLWLRRLKRVTGNTSVMQILHLTLVLLFVNHIWTCLSWLIQSLDDQGFEDYTQSLGLREHSTQWTQYSVMFMHTLQVIFAISNYEGDTAVEAWFGSLTLALSVFISATMLSKILEIWQMANEAQTQRDSRMNTVMQFTARNGISTALRNEVLDYFEFRYSNPAADFEKRFLDDLPRDMQTRVISQMFPGALEKSALFTGVSEMFTSEIIVRLARRPVPTMPQQVIIAQGGFGSEMFLVQSGTVEVSRQDEEGRQTHVKTLGPGSTFGDLSMWMDSRHSATVTSLEFCQLHMLTRQDLEETLQSFPEQGHVIAAQALSHCLRSPVLASALHGLSASAADRLGRRMAYSMVEFEPGEALYMEGDEAETAFVIRKGKVEVELLDGRLEGLDDVRCIGFDALLSCRTFQETIRARETVVAYSITANDIVELFSRDKDMLEERERVAERHYRQVTTHLAGLRWTLLSQDLCARAAEHDNLLSTFATNGAPRHHSRPRGSLADQLVSYLRPAHSSPRTRAPEGLDGGASPTGRSAEGLGVGSPLYARPLWSIDED